MSKSVPDRWLQYKPYGEVIKGTKILAFKVPLKERVSEKLHPEQQFTTASLLEAFPQLKFIVDLTNTYRYYDKTEFTDGGLRYEKIMVPGMQVPPFELVKKYFKMMDDFTSTCGEDDLIGIHCTHGVNRTGYFICRYLIQQLGWEYQDALTAFEEARGYPIERETYVNDLKLIPKGEKIDTSNVSLVPPVIPVVRKVPVRSMLKGLPLKHLSKRLVSYPPMGPSGFVRPHSIRGFANGGPFPKPFGFRAPGFGPMLPMPPIPPPPPPPGPMYGPRPVRYGPPPMRPPMPPPPPPPPPPPHPGFQNPGFPPRMPGLHRMAGPPRLHPGPPRLPLPKMLPPPPPVIKRLQAHKEKHMRNGVIMAPSRSSVLVVAREKRLRTISRPAKDQDFTIDTFEENLITALPPQRRNRGRFSQSK